MSRNCPKSALREYNGHRKLASTDCTPRDQVAFVVFHVFKLALNNLQNVEYIFQAGKRAC